MSESKFTTVEVIISIIIIAVLALVAWNFTQIDNISVTQEAPILKDVTGVEIAGDDVTIDPVAVPVSEFDNASTTEPALYVTPDPAVDLANPDAPPHLGIVMNESCDFIFEVGGEGALPAVTYTQVKKAFDNLYFQCLAEYGYSQMALDKESAE